MQYLTNGHASMRSEIFRVDGNHKLAIIVCGYKGKITSYGHVINILQKRGYDVLAYEYDTSFLDCGLPEGLNQLYELLAKDVRNYIYDYDEVISSGVSMGAGFAMSLQFEFPEISHGLYAGAGVSPAETIYDVRLFRRIRRQFLRNGYSRQDLKQAWRETDISPERVPGFDSNITIALGTWDRIVSYKKARKTFDSWSVAGRKIDVITKNYKGHLVIIGWYKRHFEDYLG